MENIELQATNFIKEIILEDKSRLGNDFRLQTRFPPEPNGFLHIGHAKAICISFDLAKELSGKCYLRMDDTNPEKESSEYVEQIKHDVSWLGYKWDELTHASDYFPSLYDYAIELIKNGKAYVDHLSPDEIRSYRGTLKEAGRESPFRDRSLDENLKLFNEMKSGKFADGECVLRAKINMQSPNLNLRDPTIYRIKHMDHQQTGSAWCIYPMYDFAHSLSDAIEGTTHSLCSLEFEDHRPLYDWFVNNCSVINKPRQIEFSRLNLEYTAMSKRKLRQLIEENYVNGWDDPRMPTLSALRNRGYFPESIKRFIKKTGVTKKLHTVEISLLESCIRDDLNEKCERRMAVIDPLKIIIENYPEDKVELLETSNHPQDDSLGKRQISFSREIFIERSDFMEEPPKKFFRLSVDKEVRLRSAYIIHCHKAIKDDQGNIIELRCTFDPMTKSGSDTSGKKVKGTIHWVDASNAANAEIRLYDRLFKEPQLSLNEVDQETINPTSLVIMHNAKLENSLDEAPSDSVFQFERMGYFIKKTNNKSSGDLLFYRTSTLRDTWEKINKN
jgi:glutaminyl-tRNA synthetase